MDLPTLGKWMVVMGAMLILAGGLVWLLGRTGVPLGRLPGDLHLEGERISCYVPIASMIVVSLLLTLVLNVIVRLLNR